MAASCARPGRSSAALPREDALHLAGWQSAGARRVGSGDARRRDRDHRPGARTTCARQPQLTDPAPFDLVIFGTGGSLERSTDIATSTRWMSPARSTPGLSGIAPSNHYIPMDQAHVVAYLDSVRCVRRSLAGQLHAWLMTQGTCP